MARPVTHGAKLRVYLTPQLLAAVQREAAVRGEGMSDVVRRALVAWFEEPES